MDRPLQIIAVDDEEAAVRLVKLFLEGIPGAEFVKGFTDPAEGIEFVIGNPVDVVFLDIEMSGMGGMDAAHRLRTLQNPPYIVFLTGHTEFALEAWEIAAAGYVLKPFGREKIREAVKRCQRLSGSIAVQSHVRIRCFPQFSVEVDGRPVSFQSKRARELLAYLVLKEGQWVMTNNIVYELFGDSDEQKGKNNYNVIAHRLRSCLGRCAVADLVEFDYGRCRLRSDLVACDYYEYLQGQTDLFKGGFLEEYSWAEPVKALMLSKV